VSAQDGVLVPERQQFSVLVQILRENRTARLSTRRTSR